MQEAKKKSELENLTENVKDYLEARYDLAVLNMQDRVSDVTSSVAASLIIISFSLLALLFISVGGALWLGAVLGNVFIGFFCIAGFYMLLALLVFYNQERWIKLPMINLLLKKININEKDQ